MIGEHINIKPLIKYDSTTEIVVIYERPIGANPIVYQKLNMGIYGKMLRATLKRYDLPFEEPQVVFLPIVTELGSKAYQQRIKYSSGGYIPELINKIKPVVIITIGLDAFKIVSNKSVVMSEINGTQIMSDKYKCPIFPFEAFTKMGNNPDLYYDFYLHMMKIKYYYENKELFTPIPTRYYVLDLDDKKDKRNFYQWLVEKNNSSAYIGIDMETTDLLYYKGKKLCVGLAYGEGKVLVVTAKDMSIIPKIFNNYTKLHLVWQNGVFDNSWFEGNTIRIDEDIMYMHYAMDSTQGTHNLENLAKLFIGANPYKSKANAYMKGNKNLGQAPLEVQYERVAEDANYTRQIFMVLHKLFKTQPIINKLYKELLLPASRFLLQVRLRGIPVDRKVMASLKVRYENKLTDIKKEIGILTKDDWDKDVYMKRTGAKSAPDIFNPASPQQVKWLLFSKLKLKPRGIKHLDTTKEVLEAIPKKNPVVLKILEYRKYAKLLSTYVIGLEAYLDNDDVSHSNLALHLTATGRLSSRNPNMQNFPQHSEEATYINSMFRAKPGRIFIHADYRSAESVTMGVMGNDKVLKDIFINKKDFHGKTAEIIFGKNWGDKERQRAKTVNFGIPYGRGAADIAHVFNVSQKIAQKWLDDWQVGYPEVTKWLNANGKKVIDANEPLITPLNRIRHWGLITEFNKKNIENEAKNFSIQSISSDLTLISAMRLYSEKHIIEKYDTYVVNLIHDAIELDCPDDVETIKKVIEELCTTMQETPRIYINSDVDFESDVNIGYSFDNEIKVYDYGKYVEENIVENIVKNR